MGGHGGLNILPQKRWHVYRRDNREIVERDEEDHKAEALRLQENQNKKRLQEISNEMRIQRGLTPIYSEDSPILEDIPLGTTILPPHINLFEEEQKVFEKQAEEHAKYLREIKHDSKIESHFDNMKTRENAPWYLQESRWKDMNLKTENKAVDKNNKSTKKDKKKKEEKSKSHKIKKSIEELKKEQQEREKHERRRQRELLRS